MNEQPITKQHIDEDPVYSLNEIFLSIQGEGPLTGEPCFFIRLAGCNLQCTWCDTDYSEKLKMSDADILSHMRRISTKIKTVIITGGEPFVQNLTPLVELLHFNGYKIQIETNGMLSIPDFPFWKVMIVCSPKAGKIHNDIQLHCNDYKYVVSTADLTSENGLPTEPTQKNGKRPPPVPKFLSHPIKTTWVMPQDDKGRLNIDAAVDIALKHGHRLSLRIHKILGVR